MVVGLGRGFNLGLKQRVLIIIIRLFDIFQPPLAASGVATVVVIALITPHFMTTMTAAMDKYVV